MSCFKFYVLWIGFCSLSVASKAEDAPVPDPPLITPKPLTVNLKHCGAKGDGISNDSAAFRAAAEQIESAGGGTLVIPTGTYIVGEQKSVPSGPFYAGQPIFAVKNVDGLVIEGNGATIRFANGLKFGAFDQNGKSIDPPLPFTDPNQAAGVGSMIEVLDSKNVQIKDLELDGNSGQFVLGGEWGDTGRQLRGCGIRLYGNSNVLIQDVNVHHQGLDGIIIGYDGYKASDTFPTLHFLKNVRSEYNARQGLSWVGGRSLVAVKCKFNHSGRGAFSSSPAAGLDIEAEGSVCREGIFSECEFVNNANCGVVADSGDGGYSKFLKCIMWGTSNFSIWVTKPGMHFRDCVIYGTIVHGYGSDDPKLATRYDGCHFEDPEDKEYDSFRGTALIHIDGPRKNVTFENCEIVANKTRAFWLDGSLSSEKPCFILRNCKITHAWADSPESIQSLFRNVTLEKTSFFEKDLAGPSIIVAQDVFVGPDVLVDGPFCAWGKKDGELGEIFQGVWNEGNLLLSDENWDEIKK